MAFSTAMHDRHLDDMRFRTMDGQQFTASGYVPLHAIADPNLPPATADVRMGLTRRFTTDAMNTPQLASAAWDQSRLARVPAAEPLDLPMDAEVRSSLIFSDLTSAGTGC
jgi:hypothetical protein